MGADGDGIGNLSDASPVYVAGSLPGERVRVRPSIRRGEGWAADIEAVVVPSADRVAPACPHFGACGGCSLQHWRAGPYAAWKSSLLAAALRRAGFDTGTAALIETTAGSRRRIDLAVRRQGGAVQLGLHRSHGSLIVDMHSCPVLHPDLFRLIAPLRDLLRGLSALKRAGAAVLNLLDTGPDLLLRTDSSATATDRTRLAAFGAAHGLPRITLTQGNFPPETAALLRPPAIRLGGVAVTPPPGGFLQASAAAESAITAAVLDGLPAGLTAKSRVAELYAGCGTLTFALAERVRVAAFEGDQAACAALKTAVNAAQLTGRIDAQHRDLSRQPLSAKELSKFAAVVLDPPFDGAAAQMAPLAASGIPRIVYVSCNPAALARDATLLRGAGYALLAATPVDQFLWSARLESVVAFVR